MAYIASKQIHIPIHIIYIKQTVWTFVSTPDPTVYNKQVL